MAASSVPLDRTPSANLSDPQDDRRQEYLVRLDPDLVNRLLDLTESPGNAIEDGLKLWLARQAADAAPVAPPSGRPALAKIPPQASRKSLDLAPNPAAAQDSLPKAMTRPNMPGGRRNLPRYAVGPNRPAPQVNPDQSNDDETGWLV